jgi:hypothetical protein
VQRGASVQHLSPRQGPTVIEAKLRLELHVFTPKFFASVGLAANVLLLVMAQHDDDDELVFTAHDLEGAPVKLDPAGSGHVVASNLRAAGESVSQGGGRRLCPESVVAQL